MAHIALAIPAYDWSVRLPTARGLLTDVLKLAGDGHKVALIDNMGSAHIEETRNIIAHEFLYDTPATHLMMIDNDVVWPNWAIHRLLSHNVACVCGSYPKRVYPIQHSVKYETDEDEGQVLRKAHSAPTGFMMVTRELLTDIAEPPAGSGAQPCPVYKSPYFPMPVYGFFNRITNGHGVRMGEDVSFCNRVKAIGESVHVDTTLKLGHIGPHMFMGEDEHNNTREIPAEVQA